MRIPACHIQALTAMRAKRWLVAIAQLYLLSAQQAIQEQIDADHVST